MRIRGDSVAGPAVMASSSDDEREREDHVERVIAQWGEVRPDLELAPVAVVARIGRAARYLDAGVEELLGKYGLNRASWDVLAALRRVGPPHRLSPTALYRSVMRTSGTMTHRLGKLHAAGWVRRVADPTDGRSLLVELTPQGRKLVDRVAAEHVANEDRLLAPLTDDERVQLAGLLRKLLVAFEREQAVPPAATG
jgi:DNA-binding MarR family transcriptional regulator